MQKVLIRQKTNQGVLHIVKYALKQPEPGARYTRSDRQAKRFDPDPLLIGQNPATRIASRFQ